MPFYFSPRCWAAWGIQTALFLAASGCAAPDSRPNYGPIGLATTSTASRGYAATSGDAARRPTPRATPSRPDTRTAARATAAGPRSDQNLEHAVIRFTHHPGDLINPPVPVRQWRFIVLHHSGEASGGYASIDRFHREDRGWDECGYHFVIGNGSESGDGEIEVGGRWLKQKHGAHTKPAGHPEYNEDGLGICLVGNFDESQPTPKQVEACNRLVAYLQARCGVPPRGVMTHGDADGAKTDCPGRYFPYDRLIPRSDFASR